jgi:Holliday junction resolvase RusA-like endonuclease
MTLLTELSILGEPRTKKTSNQIHLTVLPNHLHGWLTATLQQRRSAGELTRAILSRVKVQPAKHFRDWQKSAPIIVEKEPPNGWPISERVWVQAEFYRTRRIGDLTGYLQALGDFLQHHKVIANDRQIVSWDGSRLAHDPQRPRVVARIYLPTDDPLSKGGST